MEQKFILLIATLFITLSLSKITTISNDAKVIFSSTYYPMPEDEIIDSAKEVFESSNLVAFLTIFSDGPVISLGNATHFEAPRRIGGKYVYDRVLYVRRVPRRIVSEFVEFIESDGFLILPATKGDRNGFVCDRFSEGIYDHEVCFPEQTSHRMIDSIEREVNELIASDSSDSFVEYVPESVYVSPITIIDASDCSTFMYVDTKTMTEKYGAEFAESRFYHKSNVLPFWRVANERICFQNSQDESDLFTYSVTTKYISTYFDNSKIDIGYDNFVIGTDGSQMEPNYDSNEELPYEDGSSIFVIIIAALGGIFVIVAIIAGFTRKNRINANVQVIDPHSTPLETLNTQQQPAFYIQQTNTGPVYYATTASPNQAPTQGIYYTNQ